MNEEKQKLELIGIKAFENNADIYKIVDFLNKNLGSFNITFGLSEKNGKKNISIYKEI